jgi:hypothetical protein
MGKDNFEVKAGRGSKMEGINLIILEHFDTKSGVIFTNLLTINICVGGILLLK